MLNKYSFPICNHHLNRQTHSSHFLTSHFSDTENNPVIKSDLKVRCLGYAALITYHHRTAIFCYPQSVPRFAKQIIYIPEFVVVTTCNALRSQTVLLDVVMCVEVLRP
jgi:hypothetical protein